MGSLRYSIQARTVERDNLVEVAQVDTNPEAIAMALRNKTCGPPKERYFQYAEVIVVDQQET
jgi:hypothetical protein